MLRTIKAIINVDGSVRILEDVQLDVPRRALITILDEPIGEAADLTAFLSEAALAEDWDRPEEEEAWKHLQREQ